MSTDNRSVNINLKVSYINVHIVKPIANTWTLPLKFMDRSPVLINLASQTITIVYHSAALVGFYQRENIKPKPNLGVYHHTVPTQTLRKQQVVHPPIHIDGTAVEKVESFMFLGVHITDKLKWTTHTDSVVKKAQPSLFNLILKKFGLAPKTLNFCRCTIGSILLGCITAWYSNCTPATARLSRRWCGLHNASPGANYLPSRTPTAPDVTGRPKRSLRTTITRATGCSLRYHPEGEVSTGVSKLFFSVSVPAISRPSYC